MFANKKAWFSSSVSQEPREFWLWECGILTGWRTADYLFSDDATHPDTLRVFNSEAYLWDKVTVFHSLFLSACEKRRSVKSVSIGHYVLPPVSVQDVRNVIGRFIWECEDDQPVTLESVSDQTEAKCGVDSWTEPLNALTSRDDPMSNTPTGVSMDNLQTYSRELHYSDPSGFQCIQCKAYICSPKS
ncbi:telomere repeats-binding bouquet formation protein 2 isoform X2 [Dunckerocampus dactyliophorus]|uniref:telomere repeats-binding bouquet formation protein 2 isoform X2 n=1 Tax=Dunckerocampus dactyliophorus TaxID=161453 RepID=UPI002404C975|nr:telomere repeats-binding bouquet formation protein 2 isoform X2 [Dunckerocampus dactyliophorus]